LDFTEVVLLNVVLDRYVDGEGCGTVWFRMPVENDNEF
jgi:hypothetical protein